MGKYVLRFREIDSSLLPLVGGKGANLGELTRAGFPVPDGFSVTTYAYKLHLHNDRKFTTLLRKLEGVDFNNVEKIESIATQIRTHILSLPFPELVKSEVLKSWSSMGAEKSYAVRSSATAEDLPGASFAGQQDTYLNIIGEENLLESIQKCWASLFTARAVSYRIKNGFSHTSVSLSVIVQEMVFADCSGIMFTANPITGERKTLSIDASYGLGEALVGGIVEADNYQIRDTEIIEKKITSKKIKIVLHEKGGTQEEKVSSHKQKKQALTDTQILELAKIGTTIEEHYGCPQDIEWCLRDKKFTIVQSRPITSLYPLPENMTEGEHLFLSIGHLQMMTDAMKPLGLSIFQTFSHFLEGYFGMKTPFIYVVGSRLYMDLSQPLRYRLFAKHLPTVLSNADESASKILSEYVSTQAYKKKWKRGISFRRLFKIFPFFFGELRLFFFGDFSRIFSRINKNIKNNIDAIWEELEKTPSTQKIETIRKIIHSFPRRIRVMGILPYMPLAIGSYRLLNLLCKKWIHPDFDVDIIGKAPKGNVTTEMGLLIGDIVDSIRNYPDILHYLEEHQDSDFIQGLKDINGSEDCIELFGVFFKKYGMRCTGEIDITRNRWHESPRDFISLILNAVKNTKPYVHRSDFRMAREQGENAAISCVEQVRKSCFNDFKTFIMKRLVIVYRNTIGIREHPKYFLIQAFGIIKENLLREARNLVEQGVLEFEEDIFFLTLDEIESIIGGDNSSVSCIISRKAQFEHDSRLKPPRMFNESGKILIPHADKKIPSGALSGTPASAGVIEGRARVVERLEDAHLEQGDILVTAYTDPAWTTLFGIVGGVVTEVGGLLTHGAVIAREYGIPAVVGVDGATSNIPDGARIRVDGTQGFIEIL